MDMIDAQQAVTVAKGVSEYGMMAITAAFYLLVSMTMMITIFKWFKAIINKIIDEQSKNIQSMIEVQKENNVLLESLSEGVQVEILQRIHTLSDYAFDLAIEQVCRIIKNIRDENHIANHDATVEKARRLLTVIHENRKTKFETYIYKGKKLSSYCNSDWVDRVTSVVESEIYNEDGVNNKRAYTNVKLAYDAIKTDFYNRLS